MCNFPPWTVRTAKQNRVLGSALPSILKVANDAACPSIGCEHFLSTEYNCIAPTTRFCCADIPEIKINIITKL